MEWLQKKDVMDFTELALVDELFELGYGRMVFEDVPYHQDFVARFG